MRDFYSGAPTNGDAAQMIRSLHAYMQQLCDEVFNELPLNSTLPHIDYGSITYGDITKMANDNDLDGPNQPGSDPDHPLDWYGIDVYYESDEKDPNSNPPGAASACHYGLLSDPTAILNYLGPAQKPGQLTFLDMAKGRSGKPAPEVHITECTASEANANSAWVFQEPADWLSTHGGFRDAHVLPHSQTGAATTDTQRPVESTDISNRCNEQEPGTEPVAPVHPRPRHDRRPHLHPDHLRRRLRSPTGRAEQRILTATVLRQRCLAVRARGPTARPSSTRGAWSSTGNDK